MPRPTYLTKALAASTTLGIGDIEEFGIFTLSGSSLRIDLGTPTYDYEGLDFIIANDAGSAATVVSSGNFIGNLTTCTLASGVAVKITCAPTAAGTYRWISLGVTAT